MNLKSSFNVEIVKNIILKFNEYVFLPTLGSPQDLQNQASSRKKDETEQTYSSVDKDEDW